MKRSIMLPVFVESSLFLVIFLFLVNMISLGEYSNPNQKQQSNLKVPDSQGFNTELLQRTAK